MHESDGRIIWCFNVDFDRSVEFFWSTRIPECRLEFSDVGGEVARDVVGTGSGVIDQEVDVAPFGFNLLDESFE